MMSTGSKIFWLGAALSLSPAALSLELVRGNVGIEGYYYPRDVDSGQNRGHVALLGEGELVHYFDEHWQVRVSPFLRYDPNQTSRTKLDLPEAFIEYVDDAWSLRAGLVKVSWSVTESVNIVPHQVADILNQRDLGGNPNGTEKLGVATLSLGYQSDDTLVEFFILPWMRERGFPSVETREHLFQGRQDLQGEPTFAGNKNEFRPSFAARTERVMGNTNLALILYSGYAPAPTVTPNAGGKAALHYYLEDLVALTIQSAVGTWLLKTEAVLVNTRNQPNQPVPDDYFATVSGIEYTFIRPAATSDISAIAEWMYDSRNDGLLGSQYQNDLFVGLRWSANDFDDTSMLGGGVVDLRDGSATVHVEYSRRLKEQWRVQATLRNHFPSDNNALSALENDLLLQVKLQRFF